MTSLAISCVPFDQEITTHGDGNKYLFRGTQYSPIIYVNVPKNSQVLCSVAVINGFSKVGEEGSFRVPTVHRTQAHRSRLPRHQVALSKDDPLSVRFIEFMPFDANQWSSKAVVGYTDQAVLKGW